MVVRFPQSMHQVPGGTRQIDEVTSHIDIMPTILGFAGFDQAQRDAIQQRLSQGKPTPALAPVGADLSRLILGLDEAIVDPRSDSGAEREGVLFITHDTITEGLPQRGGPAATPAIASNEVTMYEVYEALVQAVSAPATADGPALYPGSVVQPNLVNAYISKDGWKFVRYFGPSVAEGEEPIAEQYELYDLNEDPAEQHNLLVFDAAGSDFPTPTPAQNLPEDYDYQPLRIIERAKQMEAALRALEKDMLEP